MSSFYKLQRKKLIFLLMKITIQSEVNGVLMKKIEKKIPKEFNFPKHIKNTETKHTEFLKKIIEKKFCNHIGSVSDFWICTTRKEAWKIFDNFIKRKN